MRAVGNVPFRIFGTSYQPVEVCLRIAFIGWEDLPSAKALGQGWADSRGVSLEFTKDFINQFDRVGLRDGLGLGDEDLDVNALVGEDPGEELFTLGIDPLEHMELAEELGALPNAISFPNPASLNVDRFG